MYNSTTIVLNDKTTIEPSHLDNVGGIIRFYDAGGTVSIVASELDQLDKLIEAATIARDQLAEATVLAAMLEAGNDGGIPDEVLEGGDGTCPNTGRSATVCADPTHADCPQLAPANNWQ